MRVCSKCKMKYWNNLTVCPSCKCPTIDEEGNTSPDAAMRTDALKKGETVSAPIQQKSTAPKVNDTAPARLMFSAQPVLSENCIGYTLMTVLAIITWVGGLIAAIMMSNDVRGNFQFGIFCAWIIGFGIAGGLLFALGELMRNVASIAASLREMKIEQINK